MSEEMKTYMKDERIVCKYGTKCYQKNPEHHKKYKHPPQLKGKVRNKDRYQPYVKVSPNLKNENHANDTIKDDKNKLNSDKIEEYNVMHTDSSNNSIQIEKDSNTDKELNVLNETQVLKDIVSNDVNPSTSTKDADTYEFCKDVKQNFSYYDKGTDSSVLKDLFLVDMPEDFFKFYECLSEEFQNVEQILSNVNLQLIGPYDFLLGKLPKVTCKDTYLNHWRFFYDPPEFQTVLKKKGSSQFHIGYFRDDPKEKPVFLAKNDSSKDCIITPIADDIFGAVYWYLKNEKNPLIAIACTKLQGRVKTWAEQYHYSIDNFNIKKRLMKISCRSLHSAGIVVPYDKKTQLGYRPLVENNGKIKDMFKRLSNAKSEDEKDKVLADIQPIITYSNIAMDECDFGTGLEAGIAFFCSGLKELQTSALKCLEVAYSLLGRDAFLKIIQTHLKNRRKGPDMSAF